MRGRLSKDLRTKLIIATIMVAFFVLVLITTAIADNLGTENTPGDGVTSAEQDPETVRLNAIKDRLKYSGYYTDELFEWMQNNKDKFEDYYNAYIEVIVELEEGANTALIDEFLVTLEDFRKVSQEDQTVYTESSIPAYGRVDMASAISRFDKKMQERFSDDEQVIETKEPDNLEDILKAGGLIAEAVPSLEMSYKSVTADERFRHYNIELAVKPTGAVVDPESQLAGQDIVLVLDSSDSMNGSLANDLSYGTKMTSVKLSAKWFVLNTFMKNPDNRIGIVRFAGEAETVCDLMGADQTDEIIRRIEQITAGGETNTQAAIIQAKKVLEIEDGTSVSGAERSKSIVFMSDGLPTVHYTDNINVISDTSFRGYPEQDKMRWGFGGYGSNVIVKTAYFTEPTINQAEKAKRLALLEAQYAVKQGIKIYTVDFSGGDEHTTDFLNKMTNALTDTPSRIPEKHLYPISFNPSVGVMFDSQNYDQMYFIVDSSEQLEAAFTTVIGKVVDSKYRFDITDTIDLEKFEIVDYPQASHKGDIVKVENSFVHWNIKGGTDSIRTVTYTVRVKDEVLFEQGTGVYSPGGDFAGNPNFNLKVETGNRTTLSYKNNEDREIAFAYMIPTVSIQPLVKADVFTENMSGEMIEAFLTGDNAYLGGKITSGSGSFSYQWYDGDNPINESPISIENLSDQDLIYPMDLDMEKLKSPKFTNAGKSTYTLKLFDKRAEQAGYKSKNVAYIEVPIDVISLEAKVKVEIIGDVGGFETTVYRYTPEKQGEPEKWFFSGTGTKVYENIGSGNFKVHSYVPYGYTATVDKSDGISLDGNMATFKLKPIQDGKGNWKVESPKVTIRISKTKGAQNFFDWSWGPNESLVDS